MDQTYFQHNRLVQWYSYMKQDLALNVCDLDAEHGLSEDYHQMMVIDLDYGWNIPKQINQQNKK